MSEREKKLFFDHLKEEKDKIPAYYHYMGSVSRSEQVRRITYIKGTTEVLECTSFHRPVSTIIPPVDE
ncbi:hypothetical protein AB9P05_04645 [Roseivirga sp. BDSF3-8]|uniref:hypothetical protein n=1 Tax=Roseivirga sp. BDSF3-8 TaxID=3241598 RepID=UPI003531C5FE